MLMKYIVAIVMLLVALSIVIYGGLWVWRLLKAHMDEDRQDALATRIEAQDSIAELDAATRRYERAAKSANSRRKTK